MADLTWSQGLALWILLAMCATWLWSRIVDGGRRERDHDWLAARKRKITRNGFKSRMGVK